MMEKELEPGKVLRMPLRFQEFPQMPLSFRYSPNEQSYCQIIELFLLLGWVGIFGELKILGGIWEGQGKLKCFESFY